MRTHTLAVFAAVCALTAPVRAQEKLADDIYDMVLMDDVDRRPEASEIRPGQIVTGRLEASDVMHGDGTRYDAWRWEGRRGDRIAVTMRSEEFDTYLMLMHVKNGEPTLLHQDDDGAGDTDSRLAFELPEDGVYFIYANALFEDGFGNYTLALEDGADLGSTVTDVLATGDGYPVIRVGETVRGSFTAGHPLLDDQSPYEAWVFDARAGEVVEFEMAAKDFDAYLQVGPVGGPEILDVNDDGADGTDALLAFEAPGDGRYVVLANSYGSGARGEFSLEARRGRPTVTREALLGEWLDGAPAIVKGQPLGGTLDERSPLMEDRSFFQLYTYEGRAGERITVTLRSGDFDAHLGVGRGGSDAERMWLQDDDSGGGTDSRITVQLPADGRYGIVANTLFAGSSGTYTIEVREAGAEGATMTMESIFSPTFAAAAHPVAAGQTTNGILDESSPRLEDGSPFQLWRFRGRAGDRVNVTLASEDFDAYLHVGYVNDALSRQSNDDGVSGSTDSQLTYTLDRDGDLVILANSFRSGGFGSYSLTVEQR